MFSLVSALLLAAPLVGTAQQQQLKPNELTTNVAGATTIAAPPKGFNPLTASDQDLEYYGYPPRPNEVDAPKAFARWQKAMAASKLRLMPKLEVTNNFSAPAKMKAGAVPTSGSASSSYNWSGYVNTNGVTKYSTSSFYYIIGDYVVPVATQAYGACTGGDPMYAQHSLGININLWWGIVMFAFGVVMLLLALAAGRNPNKP